MAFRNNVTHLLDSRKISYAVFELPSGPHSAQETAALLNVPPDYVYKTLVVVRESKNKKPLLVMAPAGRELDLKRLAASLNEKKLAMASQAEAEALTNSEVGGISALALLNQGFEVCIERAALQLPFIHVSAGQRGATLRLSVEDLMSMAGTAVVNTG